MVCAWIGLLPSRIFTIVMPTSAFRSTIGTAVVSLLLLTTLGLTLGCRAGRPESISDGELHEHVAYLASDELRGREAGSAGIAMAEDYIAGQFEQYGLSPLPGRDDYFVGFTLLSEHYDSERTSLSVHSEGGKSEYSIKGDFRPFSFSDSGTVQGEVVFAGYGITAPELGYDDYEGLEVEGRIVLVMRHEPNETDPDSPFDGSSHSQHALFETKARNALAHGAAGMLLYTDPIHHAETEDLRASTLLRFPDSEEPTDGNGGRRITEGLPAVHVSRTIARDILQSLQIDISDLQRQIDSNQPASKFDITGVEVALSVEMEPSLEEIPVRNVAAILPGTDRGLRDEWLVIGAHHDHLGAFPGSGDTIYNGADDNASGTSAVLELAEQFASLRPRPRRSIVFMTFTAEEKGLFGSRALDRYDLIPMDQVGFMINLDMIGRNPSTAVTIIGDGFVEGLKVTLEGLNEAYDLPLLFSGRRYQPFSDNDVFKRNRVPFVMFFTGEHEDYHQTSDHTDRLAYDRMESLTRFAFDLAAMLAGMDTLPAFN